MITTKTVNGVQIAFDDQGHEPGPVFVTLSGWAHDLRAYDGMLPYLRAAQRTVRVCWRGHGPDRNLVGDFGIDEMAADTIGLLDALEVDSFVPIAPETTVAKPWMAGGEIVVKCVVLPDLGM